jgi:hypothetical protein
MRGAYIRGAGGPIVGGGLIFGGLRYVKRISFVPVYNHYHYTGDYNKQTLSTFPSGCRCEIETE